MRFAMDKSQYFYRSALYQRNGEKITLIDPFDRKLKTELDPWLGIVVSLADGKHSIAELLDYLESRYGNQAPDKLTQTVESAVERLLESKAIQLSDKPVILPYYLETSAEKHDIEQVKTVMLEDGFIVE